MSSSRTCPLDVHLILTLTFKLESVIYARFKIKCFCASFGKLVYLQLYFKLPTVCSVGAEAVARDSLRETPFVTQRATVPLTSRGSLFMVIKLGVILIRNQLVLCIDPKMGSSLYFCFDIRRILSQQIL